MQKNKMILKKFGLYSNLTIIVSLIALSKHGAFLLKNAIMFIHHYHNQSTSLKIYETRSKDGTAQSHKYIEAPSHMYALSRTYPAIG